MELVGWDKDWMIRKTRNFFLEGFQVLSREQERLHEFFVKEKSRGSSDFCPGNRDGSQGTPGAVSGVGMEIRGRFFPPWALNSQREWPHPELQ